MHDINKGSLPLSAKSITNVIASSLTSYVQRVKSINIFLRQYLINDSTLIEVFWKRHLDKDTRNLRVLIELPERI